MTEQDEEVVAEFTDDEYDHLDGMFKERGWGVFFNKIMDIPIREAIECMDGPCDDKVLRAINGMCMYKKDLTVYIASLLEDIKTRKEERKKKLAEKAV